MRIRAILGLGLLLATLALPLLANKSAVSIEAPATAKAGEEVTIIINVSHRGNSSLHHTKRLLVLANGQEIARWNFSSGHRPEAENFSREVKLKIEAETEIVAEATCNLHGSAGPASARIKIAE
ncbi:MAG: desulfoferrodoxin family protein [Candidatus Saccharicenans sp.]|jgi:desulfoferrodoxin (superoxide reductase-like protein)|nr:desulfoferrodoxin family protein [Candidatus Saccharicenans sp.]MDH7492737.1 desulfoferrodoxin family protein [Candidatus Saccharicenans sp.]